MSRKALRTWDHAYFMRHDARQVDLARCNTNNMPIWCIMFEDINLWHVDIVGRNVHKALYFYLMLRERNPAVCWASLNKQYRDYLLYHNGFLMIQLYQSGGENQPRATIDPCDFSIYCDVPAMDHQNLNMLLYRLHTLAKYQARSVTRAYLSRRFFMTGDAATFRSWILKCADPVIHNEALAEFVLRQGSPYLARLYLAAMPQLSRPLFPRDVKPAMQMFWMRRSPVGAEWLHASQQATLQQRLRNWDHDSFAASLLVLVDFVADGYYVPSSEALSVATFLRVTHALPMELRMDICMLVYAWFSRGFMTDGELLLGRLTWLESAV